MSGRCRGCARGQVWPFGPIQGIQRAEGVEKAAVAGKKVLAPGAKGKGARPVSEPFISEGVILSKSWKARDKKQRESSRVCAEGRESGRKPWWGFSLCSR